MRTAFKEWAAVCRALAAGEQILILRKGGIIEDSGEFAPEHDRFLLFPTYVHQQDTGLLPAARHFLDEARAAAPPEGALALSHYAVCENAVTVDSLNKLHALRGFHIWSDDVVLERFHRWGEDSVYAMILRVYTLPEPVTVALTDAYGGCKSWVELDDEIDVSAATPVLDDMAFMHKASALRHSLTVF